MNDKRLTDKQLNTVGWVKQESSGKLRLTDPQLKTLGYYDPKEDRTTDNQGRTVGHGNLLTSFLRGCR
jgi:hypothetical protein